MGVDDAFRDEHAFKADGADLGSEVLSCVEAVLEFLKQSGALSDPLTDNQGVLVRSAIAIRGVLRERRCTCFAKLEIFNGSTFVVAEIVIRKVIWWKHELVQCCWGVWWYK